MAEPAPKKGFFSFLNRGTKPPTKKVSLLQQITLVLYYLMEKLFVLLLRVNLCLFLRYELGITELWATFYFHLYEMFVYTAAFVFGQIAILKMQPLIFASPWCYILSCGLLGLTIQTNGLSTIGTRALIILTVIFFGLTNGLNMVSNLKLVEYEMKPSYFHFVTFLSIILDILGNAFIPIAFAFTSYNKAFFQVGLGMGIYMGILIIMQFLINIQFFREPKHPEFHLPFSHITCIAYRMALPFKEVWTAEGRKKIMARSEQSKLFETAQLKKRKGLELTPEEEKLEYHWLDPIAPEYQPDFIKDLKFRLRYWKILLALPGVFMAFELRYSFWIFSIQRLDRMVFKKNIPSQVMFSLQQLVVLLFIPAYSFLINPLLRQTFIKKPLRRIGLGALLLLFGVLTGIVIVYEQEVMGIRTNEPYFEQTKIAVRNGLTCEIVVNERMSLQNQQWYFGKTRKAIQATPQALTPDKDEMTAKQKRYLKKVDENDFLYDKMANKKRLLPKEFIYPTLDVESGDSATFYIKMAERLKNDQVMQSMAIVPVRCQTEKPFNFLFLKSSDDRRDTANMTILLVEPTKISIHNVQFTRPTTLDPAVRFLFANRTPVQIFQVMRGSDMIFNFPQLENLSMDYYYFEAGDGYNLDFVVDTNILKVNYTFKRGGIYDIVFIDHLGSIVKIKIYTSESPHRYPFRTGVTQYVFVGIGDIMFGVLALRFLYSQTPPKFHLHAFCDWNLARAWSNALIIIIVKSGWVITFFWQVSLLTIVCALNILLFYIAAWQYIYLYPPEMKSDEELDTKLDRPDEPFKFPEPEPEAQ